MCPLHIIITYQQFLLLKYVALVAYHTGIGKLVQFSSVAQSCPTLCDPMNPSTPGLPVHHHLLEFTQIHVHWVGDAIQPSHPLSSPSPPAPNPSQHQGLFQWVNSSHEVARVLEFQLQHQSFTGAVICYFSFSDLLCSVWISSCIHAAANGLISFYLISQCIFDSGWKG